MAGGPGRRLPARVQTKLLAAFLTIAGLLIVVGAVGLQVLNGAVATRARVQVNGKHLLGLINDVLDLSKIEAGQLELVIDNYSAGQIVKAVAAATEPLARAKRLQLNTVIAEGMPLGRGDERRLTQVLLNLAGNAVKFTDAGSVEILAEASNGSFEFTVRDTGPGIAPEFQARIFEEFQQVDDAQRGLRRLRRQAVQSPPAARQNPRIPALMNRKFGVTGYISLNERFCCSMTWSSRQNSKSHRWMLGPFQRCRPR